MPSLVHLQGSLSDKYRPQIRQVCDSLSGKVGKPAGPSSGALAAHTVVPRAYCLKQAPGPSSEELKDKDSIILAYKNMVDSSSDDIKISVACGPLMAADPDRKHHIFNSSIAHLLPYQRNILGDIVADHSMDRHCCILGPKVA